MIEKQVEQLEAGKGVQQTAHNGGVGILHKPADVGVSGQCNDTMLDAEQNGDGKCHPASWQNGGDPEERAAEQVEGIGADEVGAQIGVPVPAEATAAHGVVGKIVERNLLRIEIAVVNEIAAVCDDDGQEYQQQRAESQKKGQQVAPPLAVPGIGAKGNVFHEWCAPYSVCLRQKLLSAAAYTVAGGLFPEVSAEGSPEKDDIGHDTAVHDVHVAVGGSRPSRGQLALPGFIT